MVATVPVCPIWPSPLSLRPDPKLLVLPRWHLNTFGASYKRWPMSWLMRPVPVCSRLTGWQFGC